MKKIVTVEKNDEIGNTFFYVSVDGATPQREDSQYRAAAVAWAHAENVAHKLAGDNGTASYTLHPSRSGKAAWVVE